MLELRVYSKAELVEIFGTDDTQGLKRKLQRYGIEFQTTGRGSTLTFNITKTADPFKVFCIDELGYDGRTDFRKLRDFLYTFEVNSRIVGAFDGDAMLGCSIVGKLNGEYCLDFLCIDDRVQKTGIGSILLEDVENWVRVQGTGLLILEARVTAQKFYEKHGYEAYGEVYLMEKSPVDHIMMRKFF